MQGRVELGFRRRLQLLLAAATSEERERELERVLSEGRRPGPDEAATARALLRAYEATRERLRGAAPGAGSTRGPEAPRFLCDQSLGGLARWLRAAGYEASLAPEVPGHRLPERALSRGLVLVTTDTEVLDRRLVVDGSLRVVWMPSSLTTREKLGFVLRELGLERREPRCMACGGRLEPRVKDTVRARIPPRTAGWKDEYYVCAVCERLYWQGTHWQRISPALRAAVVAA